MLQNCGFAAQNAGVHTKGFTWQYGDCAEADGVPIERLAVTRAAATITAARANFNFAVIEPPGCPAAAHRGYLVRINELTDFAFRLLPESAPVGVYVALQSRRNSF